VLKIFFDAVVNLVIQRNKKKVLVLQSVALVCCGRDRSEKSSAGAERPDIGVTIGSRLKHEGNKTNDFVLCT
jgi:hypothetical protein